jgi:hypothetical protein
MRDFGFGILDLGLARRRGTPLGRALPRLQSKIQNPKSKIVRRGFALVDVIIGGVLLALGLAAIISLATRSLRTQTVGEKTLTASWLADELLALVVVDGPVNYPRLHDTNGDFEFPFEDFSYDIELESQGNDLPYIVTATVAWDDGRRSIAVQTLVAERNDDPDELRAPPEPIDREERWYGEEEEQGGSATGGANAPS